MNIRKKIRKILTKPFFKILPEEFELGNIYYSQFGEDVFLKNLLGEKKCGFYKVGWSGIRGAPDYIRRESRCTESLQIMTQALESILNKRTVVPDIDFMSVNCEGYDFSGFVGRRPCKI